MAPPQELLANVDLFRDLDKRELREVADAMKEYTFSAGREIVTQGQDGVGFFVIAEGTAKVTVDGGEVRRLQAGDYFGEIALLADSPLLDCGRGVLACLREDDGWPAPDAIVITHFHLDHWGDLVPWVWGTRYLEERGKAPQRSELWVPTGGRSWLAQLGSLLGFA